MLTKGYLVLSTRLFMDCKLQTDMPKKDRPKFLSACQIFVTVGKFRHLVGSTNILGLQKFGLFHNRNKVCI